MSIISDFIENKKVEIKDLYEKTSRLISRMVNILIYKRYSKISKTGVLEKFDEGDLVDGCYIVPDDVVEIGVSAFSYAHSLKKVIIPSSVKRIDDYAFEECYNLEEVVLNDGLIQIGDCAFYHTFIESIKIPESVKIIGRSCFRNCYRLTSCELPKNIEFLSGEVFKNCENLKRVNIPENIEILPHSFFYNCLSLKKITLPSGLKAIGSQAFRQCRGLKQISFPNTTERINECAFSGCINLTYITLPPKLKILEYSVFSYCASLEKIRLPDGLVKINPQALSNCNSLSKLRIPSRVEKIDSTAFAGTPIKKLIINDKEVEIPKGQYSPIGCFYPFLNYATKNNCFIPKISEIVRKTKDEEIENFFKYSKDWKKFLDKYLELQKEYGKQNNVNINTSEVMANLYQICVALGLFQNLTKQKRNELIHFIEKNILTINPEDLHRLYSGLETEVYGYNKEFAEFYIKNYKPPVYDKEGNVLYFMEAVEDYYDDEDDFDRYYDGDSNEADETDLEDELEENRFDPNEVEIINYVEQAYNNWEQVKEVFPNKTVLNHREHASENNNLTLEDIIHALNCVEYENVHEGNEDMAEMVGKYGYGQEDFERLQAWWDLGKTITDEQRTLKIKEDSVDNSITYELLKNNNEEILILGEETNCCQTVNDAGSECVNMV